MPRAYLNSRHVCDGGDVGCSFRRRTRSNMSILQGFPTTKCTPERSLRDRGHSLPQWARNGRWPLLSAPSLRVAARRPADGGAVPARLRVGATRERARARRIESRAHARLRGRIPGNRGPCSTLRRAVCFVARLDPIDIWPAPCASHPSRPGHNASRAYY